MNKEDAGLIRKAVERLSGLKEIKGIVLFGSFAKGTEHKGSDIDLLIITEKKRADSILPKAIRAISKIDVEGRISLRPTNLKDHDASFYQNILREGKILFGKFVMNAKGLELQPSILVSYDLTTVAPSIKAKISKAVHGYDSKKKISGKIKKYHYDGLLEKTKAVFLAPGTILIPEEERGFLDFLKRENVKMIQRKIWIE